MKTLITGIAGFVGSYLAGLLLDRGCKVFGTVMPGEDTRNIAEIAGDLSLAECDIRDKRAVKQVVTSVQPDQVYHLAAVTSVASSSDDPAGTFETNLMGTLHLFESLRSVKGQPQILFVGSAEEYGLVEDKDLPITETCPLRPISPYSVSKAAADLLAFQYARSYGLHIVRVRPFNHTGPRQCTSFVCSDFARQVAQIEAAVARRDAGSANATGPASDAGEEHPALSVGNLEVRRDFTDVRDMVRAYWLALERCEQGEVYNICSGAAYRIRDILDILLSASQARIIVQTDPGKLRPMDVPVAEGDCTKFRRKTGWKPEIHLDRTLRDLLEYWRVQIGQAPPTDDACGC